MSIRTSIFNYELLRKTFVAINLILFPYIFAFLFCSIKLSCRINLFSNCSFDNVEKRAPFDRYYRRHNHEIIRTTTERCHLSF
jgi:hypothetical protein